MIKAQEQERSRLAREVHDGPAQVLANAILGIELCEQIARRSPEQLIDEMARLKSSLREGLVEVRRFQFDLRPSSLAERGLLVTLQRYINEYRSFFKLTVELQLPEELPPLNKDEELQIFRIVQEALQNIQKHARATVIVVRLVVDDDAIVATIRDDGRGFVPQHVESTTLSGAGLRGMGERAAAVGGELTVESELGVGSTVRFSLPRVGG
jgi:two-component system sensor histidine kinase DegS